MDSELRAVMEAKGLDQTELARLAQVSQATVSRVLRGGVRKRRGRAYLRLCNYIHQQTQQQMFPTISRERVHEAIDRIWDASRTHAEAIMRIVDALDRLRTSRMKEE